jgi:peptidoglycan/LPS O-acetylase OafA/YrhL
VLSLLAVHVFPQWIHGGSIGTGMFFVLSGYLISESVLRAHDAGSFDLVAFYSRRIQRVVPSLCLVLFSVLSFSVLFTYPAAARQIGEDVFTGSLLMSNFALWREAAFFDVTSEPRALMHLWWLGVEVQFYLVWPLMMILMLRYRNWAWHLFAMLSLGSLALFVLLVDSPTSAHMMLPVTRWWELMLGALLAGMMRSHGGGPAAWLQGHLGKHSAAAALVPDALASCGLSLLLMATLMFDGSGSTPAWWSILPALGTFALLSAGSQASINRLVLSRPILRFYGSISYPLYLWHWPMLTLPTVMGMPLTHELRIIILTASVVLAALTHEMAEKPYQMGNHRSSVPKKLIAIWMTVAALGLLVQNTGGLLSTFPESMRSGPMIQIR